MAFCTHTCTDTLTRFSQFSSQARIHRLLCRGHHSRRFHSSLADYPMFIYASQDCMELLLPMAAKKLDLSFNIDRDVPPCKRSPIRSLPSKGYP